MPAEMLAKLGLLLVPAASASLSARLWLSRECARSSSFKLLELQLEAVVAVEVVVMELPAILPRVRDKRLPAGDVTGVMGGKPARAEAEGDSTSAGEALPTLLPGVMALGEK